MVRQGGQCTKFIEKTILISWIRALIEAVGSHNEAREYEGAKGKGPRRNAHAAISTTKDRMLNKAAATIPQSITIATSAIDEGEVQCCRRSIATSRRAGCVESRN